MGMFSTIKKQKQKTIHKEVCFLLATESLISMWVPGCTYYCIRARKYDNFINVRTNLPNKSTVLKCYSHTSVRIPQSTRPKSWHVQIVKVERTIVKDPYETCTNIHNLLP